MLNFAIKKIKKPSPLIKIFSKTPLNKNKYYAKEEKNQDNLPNNSELQELDLTTTEPSIIKLLEYTKVKKTLTYEELSDILPEHITNTDKIEQVLALLEANNIQLIEEDSLIEAEETGTKKEKAASKKKSTENDK